MGTSSCSKGPGKGVSFDPEWLDEINLLDQGQNQPEDLANDETPHVEPLLAPKARFGTAKRHIREVFESGGARESFYKAAGNYSRTGMGGASRLAHRMRTTSIAGSRAANLLRAIREQTDPRINEWVYDLLSHEASSEEVIDAIIQHSMPLGGRQEEISAKSSMADAMADLLEHNDDIDFLKLSENHIWALMETYLATEAYNRICFDMGEKIDQYDLSAEERHQRQVEIREYIKEDVSVHLSELRNSDSSSSQSIESVLKKAIERTFEIYEGYL